MPGDLDIPPPGPVRGNSGLYRVSQSQPLLDRTMRRALLAGGGVVAALVVVAVGWHFMQPHPVVVPVIEADSRPVKVRPDNPGGLQVAGADEAILSDMGGARTAAGGARPGGEANDQLGPAPEAPAPEALKAQQAQQALQAKRAAAAAAAAQAAASVPAAHVAVAPPAPPPLRATPASAAIPPQPAAAVPAGTQTGNHVTLVQLASTDTEQAAQAAWVKLGKRMPELIAKRRMAVVRSEHDGRAVWRLRTGGFTDTAQATAFCAQVRAHGAGCSIATF